MIQIDVPVQPHRLRWHAASGRYRTWENSTDLMLSWSHPTTRSDGSPFLPEHLAYYEIEFAGQNYNMGTATEGIINTTLPGPWLLRIRTIDTAGQISAWSSTLTVSP